MNISDILLVIISSAGLLHGFGLAMYLCFFKRKKSLANFILGLILVMMAFRIGKSVLLNFGNHLEPMFIVIGLAFLLIIGPLLRWYVLAMTQPKFKLSSKQALELIPFFLVIVMSFFTPSDWQDISNSSIVVFGSILISIYVHFELYIFLAARRVQKVKKAFKHKLLTKFQQSVLTWLRIVIIGCMAIWVSYFLNIIENTVPYIIGPILYTIVVYFLSFKAFQLKITDIDGDVFEANDDTELFDAISKLVTKEKLFLQPDISLSGLAKILGKTTQKTSEIINQYAQHNFNDYINFFRIQEAKKMLQSDSHKNYTISSIAFDVGFNSLSSFNSAFKKFEGITPSSYRKAE